MECCYFIFISNSEVSGLNQWVGTLVLGVGKTLSASERLKQKKLAAKLQAQGSTPPVNMETGDHHKPNADAVSRITEIANKFIALGDMDFYQETYESLSHKVSAGAYLKLR